MAITGTRKENSSRCNKIYNLKNRFIRNGFFMEKKYISILLGLSFLFCNCVAFLDEGRYSFNYMLQAGDWVAMLLYTALFMVVPLALFISIKKSMKTRFYLSLWGFSPIIIFILLMIP